MLLGGGVRDSNLPGYTAHFFSHYGGGFLPFYGYFYLSWPGVALMAAWCGFIFRLVRGASSSGSGLVRCVALYVVITVPRWYMYSPSQIFRGVMLMCVAYCVIGYADRASKAYYRFMYGRKPAQSMDL